MKTQFNKSEIFKSAWNLVKTAGKSLSEALKAAWAKAKAPVLSLKEKAEAALPKLREEYASYIKFNVWEKGEHCRLYVDRKGRAAYINLHTGEFVLPQTGASMRGLLEDVLNDINA